MPLLKIEVTADDIAKGKPDDCTRCPVARALRRHGIKSPYVDSGGIIGVIDGKRIRFLAPDTVVNFVDAFDAHKSDVREWEGLDDWMISPKPNPFSFDLDIPVVK